LDDVLLRTDKIFSTSPFYTCPDLLGRDQTRSDVFKHVWTCLYDSYIITGLVPAWLSTGMALNWHGPQPAWPSTGMALNWHGPHPAWPWTGMALNRQLTYYSSYYVSDFSTEGWCEPLAKIGKGLFQM